MTANPCPECRTWRGCFGMSYYEARDIRYCPQQNLWMIQEFIKIEGERLVRYVTDRYTWPNEKQETGYTEAPPTQHSLKFHAPYERICQVVDELCWRLQKTGKDGQLLFWEAKSDRALYIPSRSQQLSRTARNALYYSSGNKRKNMPYGMWLKQRNYLNKKKNYYQKVVLPP